MVAALLAALVVGIGQAAGWRGVDVAAQVYRVDSFRHSGFTLWDLQWFGGHWTLNYSVLYPPLAAWLSVPGLAVLSAGLAALAFDRVIRNQLGAGGWAASLVFAAGTVVPSAIGQLTFLLGAAFGLAAFWAATRHHAVVAVALAAAAALASPLAGAFVAMAAAAWLLARWRAGDRPGSPMVAIGLGVSGAAPVIALAIVFPGQGSMPYPTVDYLWELAVAGGVWLAAGREQPAIRWGCVLFAAVASIAIAFPSPLGGNVGRLEDVLALPLAAGLLWSKRQVWLAAGAVPLVLSQWGPAWGAMAGGPASAAAGNRALFAPLDARLAALSRSGPAGRVEVVPTAAHWEVVDVAPIMPLARGWERQLDVADNPLFYRKGELTPASYRAWLLSNGVRFVALPNAPLDPAGQLEGRLVQAGTVTGLEMVWRTPEWRLFEVEGSPGIVSGPAHLVSAEADRLIISATRPGPVVVRVRYTPDWTLQGQGCLARDSSPWIVVRVPRAERFALSVSLLDRPADSCPQPARPARTAVAASTNTARPSAQRLSLTNGAFRKS